MKILLSYPDPFNSRPHKEVDDPGPLRRGGLTLSIHDITRRSNILNNIHTTIINLSIHDLTRRSTFNPFSFNIRIVFQFTTSQGGRPSSSICPMNPTTFNSRPHKEVDDFRRIERLHRLSPFNSRPHKEVDSSGEAGEKVGKPFNSRPHKEVDRNPGCRDCHAGCFQFTTSQGGRHRVF